MAPAADDKAEISGRIPNWLTANVFEELLKKNVPNFKSIKEFNAQPATALGDNYATNILRINITLELSDHSARPVSFIMKLPLDMDIMTELLEHYDIFSNETILYEQVLPDFKQMYRKAGVDVIFAPQHYKLGVEHSLILLDDLRPSGFKNANRTEGLDMAHTKSVLKKLAQYHAASAVRVETKGMYPQMFVTGQYSDEARPTMELMTAAVKKTFLKNLARYEGHELYGAAVEKLLENIMESQYQNTKCDPNEFNVLNHGDCWTNNIMFQYDSEGNIKETYFIDFQVPKYGAPAQDLFFFIIGSPKLELKLEHFEYLIRYYHEHLVESLKLLKYSKKIPTLRELHVSLLKHGLWAFWATLSVMSVALWDPIEHANLGVLFQESEEANKLKEMLYGNDRYQTHIAAILPWLYNRGLLE